MIPINNLQFITRGFKSGWEVYGGSDFTCIHDGNYMKLQRLLNERMGRQRSSEDTVLGENTLENMIVGDVEYTAEFGLIFVRYVEVEGEAFKMPITYCLSYNIAGDTLREIVGHVPNTRERILKRARKVFNHILTAEEIDRAVDLFMVKILGVEDFGPEVEEVEEVGPDPDFTAEGALTLETDEYCIKALMGSRITHNQENLDLDQIENYLKLRMDPGTADAGYHGSLAKNVVFMKRQREVLFQAGVTLSIFAKVNGVIDSTKVVDHFTSHFTARGNTALEAMGEIPNTTHAIAHMFNRDFGNVLHEDDVVALANIFCEEVMGMPKRP